MHIAIEPTLEKNQLNLAFLMAGCQYRDYHTSPRGNTLRFLIFLKTLAIKEGEK